MKIIIHIGMHKTGSSSLQQTYFENYDLLLSNGVLFPKSCFKQLVEYGGKENTTCGHEFLVEALYKTGKKKHNIIAALREEIALTKPNVVFLSAENLTHPLGGDLSENLYESLKKISNKLEVVVSLREPFSWFDSYYREVVTNGWGFEMRKFESYIKEYYGMMFFGDLINRYCDVFGRSNVHVIAYGSNIFKDGIENIFSRVLFEKRIDFKKNEGLVNQSSSDRRVETLRLFNKRVLPSEAARKAVIFTPFLEAAPSREILFTKSQMQNYSALVKNNILEIDRKLFICGNLEELLAFPHYRKAGVVDIDLQYLDSLLENYSSWSGGISKSQKIIALLRKFVSMSGRSFQIKFRRLWMAK